MRSLGAELLYGAVALVAALAIAIGIMRASARVERRKRAAARTPAGGVLPVGVAFFAPGADLPTHAVLSVEDFGPAKVAVRLQPIDGGAEASIIMPRATARTELPELLAARGRGGADRDR
jgi:hypothetical protein